MITLPLVIPSEKLIRSRMNFAVEGSEVERKAMLRVHHGEPMPNAVTSAFTYDPTFNQPLTITDPLSHTTTFSYDAAGGLSSITDPLGHQTLFTVNSIGKVATVTDAVGNATQFTYTGGDLTAVTDPMMNTTNRFLDGAGRLAEVTNALGRITRYSYNALNQITQITDPIQGATNFTYDSNGNLLTVQDANQNLTTYTYNDHDLVATRTDPLQRTESYTYDTNENLATFTDRKGQVTTYQYDNLDRLNFVGFGAQGNTYASTISYQYDAGNRVQQATDSISGVITRGYDGLNRLTSETTPQGSISYTYDNASRRATMQVAGQPQVSYTFDNANRLTQIAQGTSTVGFSYDNANRRSTLTLPNGIVATYSYDNDSHVAGISYALNSTSVGALNYGYDALGMRTAISGSMARTGLPQPIPSASYDAGNELLAWNEYAFSYDANGNMLGDGVHNYAWDARNHLSTIDAGSTGSFVYDPAGRRATKVISGSSTSFLYDLANPVQELTGTTPTANLLTGGVDEYFTRTDASGTANFLTDALGSTAALGNSSGSLQTQYSFDPFGSTAQSGVSTTNSFAFTGREVDSAGLYFHRARYYSTMFERFISEDPIGFHGGINRYAYVRGNPINYSDPMGLQGGVPDCGVDCVLSPGEQDAIQQQISARDNALAAAEKMPNPMAGHNCGCPNNHLSTGVALTAATVNPFTSGGGGVWGLNSQSDGGTTTQYAFDGKGGGLDVGVSGQSVWAWGNGPWVGEFDSVNLSVGVLGGSIFWTPGPCGWIGASFGVGLSAAFPIPEIPEGTPGSIQTTNYVPIN